MEISYSLASEARSLSVEERKSIIAAIPETELHQYLAKLFRAMDPTYLVEITHGAKELGKDLVIFRDDPISPDVTAVVVKRGDIRAKTASDVDTLKGAVDSLLSSKGARAAEEIRSQVQQSQRHPAELKSVFRRLKVTKVVIILAGDISTSVRTRFEQEVNSAAVVRDMSWLITAFAEFYPQIFFDARLTDFLYGRIRHLEEDIFYSRTGRTLSECFVEPIIRLDTEISADANKLALNVRSKRIRLSSFGEYLQRKRCVLLVGDAGSGKSKAVAKICIDVYRKILADATQRGVDNLTVPIPVVIKARDFEVVTDLSGLRASLVPHELSDRFRIGSLIIDGLDEVLASGRETVVARAVAFANELDAVLLITARNTSAFGGAPDGFARCELLPFEVAQALKLVDKVLTSKELLPVLKTGIQKIRAQLPMSPLSLLLLIDLVTERKEVPSSIAELYDRFLDLVFGRWDKDKGVDVLFEYVVKKRFLAALAYREFYLKNELEIPGATFNEFVTQFAMEYGWDDSRLHEFVKEIERAGIISVDGECVFRHRSFLDYFVAFYYHERKIDFPDFPSTLVQLYFDPRWSDVAFFVTGIARELPREVVDGILGWPENRPVDKLMVGRLLQAGWFSPTSLKEQAIRGALEYVVPTSELVLAVGLKGVNKKNAPAPEVYANIYALVLAESSLGSSFLSQELTRVLSSFKGQDIQDKNAAMKQLACLWSLRSYTDDEEMQKLVGSFARNTQDASLSANDEAEILLLASTVGQKATTIHKAIMRRLRRIVKLEPFTLKHLFPGTKAPLRSPMHK